MRQADLVAKSERARRTIPQDTSSPQAWHLVRSGLHGVIFADKDLNPPGVIEEAFNDAAFLSACTDLQASWAAWLPDVKDKDKASRSELFIAAEGTVAPRCPSCSFSPVLLGHGGAREARTRVMPVDRVCARVVGTVCE